MVCFVLAANTASGADVIGMVLNGTCDYIVRPGNVKPVYSEHYNFEVTVSGGKWTIVYEVPEASRKPEVLHVRGIASCDGKDIYLVQYQGLEAVKQAWGDRFESVRHELPVAQAEIFPGKYPPPNPIVLQQLWFAFASDEVFSGSSGKAKPPAFVDLAIFYRADFECLYSWKNSETTRQLDLRNDGRMPRRELGTGTFSFRPVPPYTSGVGLWLRNLDIADIFVPQSFEYTEFAPPAGAQTSGGLLKTWAFRCIVTNAHTGAIAPILATLPVGRVLITDRRFIEEGYSKIDYISTNGWISRDDSYVTAQLVNRPKLSLEEEFVRTRRHAPTRTGKPVKFVIWMSIALPLGLLFGKAAFGKMKQNKQNEIT